MNTDFQHGETDEQLIPPWVYRLAAQWRIFVPLAIVISAITYIAVHARTYHYESKGFVALHRNVSQYNAQRPAFYDAAQLQNYLDQKRKLNTPDGQYLIGSLTTAFLNKSVVLTMPYGKDDIRYVGDNDHSALVSTGLDLTMQSVNSGEEAAGRLQLLAGFVIDQMLKQTLTSELRSKLFTARSQRQSLDNKLIDTDQNLRELATRLVEMRKIAARYPEASRLSDRQLLTTTSESGRFLSPMAQIIGLESDIAALKTKQERLKRSEKANTIALRFYEDLYKKLPTTPTGEQLLNGFVAEIDSYFGSTPPVDDVAREIYNDQLMLVQSVRSQGLAAPRFTSGPTVPTQMQGIPRHVLLLLSLAAGLIVAGALTLLLDILKSSGKQVRWPFARSTNEASFLRGSDAEGSATNDPSNERRCA